MFAIAGKGGVMVIPALFIRGGNKCGHRSFFPAHTNDVPEEEVLTSFLTQFYEEVPPPKLILLDRPLGESQLLSEALSERPGRKVALRVPRRGAHTKMLRQAKPQAEEEHRKRGVEDKRGAERRDRGGRRT